MPYILSHESGPARQPSTYLQDDTRKDAEKKFEAIAERAKKAKIRPNTWHTPNFLASTNSKDVLNHPEEAFRQKRPFLPRARPSPPPPEDTPAYETWEDRALAVPTMKQKDDGSGYVVRWTEDCTEAHRRARIARKTGMVPLPRPAHLSPPPSQYISASQSSPAGLRATQAHLSPPLRIRHGPAFDSQGPTSSLEVDDARSNSSFRTTLGPGTLHDTHFNLMGARVALESQYSINYPYPDIPPPPPAHRSQFIQTMTKPKKPACAAEAKPHISIRDSTCRTSASANTTAAANPPTHTHRGRSSSHMLLFQALTPEQAPSSHLPRSFDSDTDRNNLKDEDENESEDEDGDEENNDGVGKFEKGKSNKADEETQDEDWEHVSATSSTKSNTYDKISLASASGDEADDEKEVPGTNRRRAVLFAYHVARLERTGRFTSNQTWREKIEKAKAKAKACEGYAWV